MSEISACTKNIFICRTSLPDSGKRESSHREAERHSTLCFCICFMSVILFDQCERRKGDRKCSSCDISSSRIGDSSRESSDNHIPRWLQFGDKEDDEEQQQQALLLLILVILTLTGLSLSVSHAHTHTCITWTTASSER